MSPDDMIYAIAGLPLAGLALQAWGRWASGRGGPVWVPIGVVLAAFGIDGMRLLLKAVGEAPAPWAWWVTVALLALALFSGGWRTWKRLRPPRRPKPLGSDLV